MSKKGWVRALGPGILFASTCIGVSHLVQSTRAGAEYGFTLLWAIIIANLFKYPFFQFASRYTGATGKSIIDGYGRVGRWILYLYFLISIPSMFIVTAAVTFVSAGLLTNLMGLSNDSMSIIAMVLFLICMVILLVGKYHVLDNLLKMIGVVLVISTLIAFFSAIMHGPVEHMPDFIPPNAYDRAGIIFLIALMGWMPTAVDISTWPSLWAEEKIRDTGYRPTMKEILFDFDLGYLISAVLAVCFLTLGALIIYGTGTGLSNSSPVFADQLITMFTTAIGKWSYTIIAIAAFSTMFSTTITVIDGFGRSITRTTKLILGKSEEDSRKAFAVWIFVICLGSFLIISQYLNQLKALVDLATILSFVIAPVMAVINFRVINHTHVPLEHRPGTYLNRLAVAGIVFLTVFTILYVYVYFT